MSRLSIFSANSKTSQLLAAACGGESSSEADEAMGDLCTVSTGWQQLTACLTRLQEKCVSGSEVKAASGPSHLYRAASPINVAREAFSFALAIQRGAWRGYLSQRQAIFTTMQSKYARYLRYQALQSLPRSWLPGLLIANTRATPQLVALPSAMQEAGEPPRYMLRLPRPYQEAEKALLYQTICRLWQQHGKLNVVREAKLAFCINLLARLAIQVQNLPLLQEALVLYATYVPHAVLDLTGLSAFEASSAAEPLLESDVLDLTVISDFSKVILTDALLTEAQIEHASKHGALADFTENRRYLALYPSAFKRRDVVGEDADGAAPMVAR